MYDKKAAVMTRGLAILCMVVLHLFCSVGDDVIGQPLLWLSEDRPFVYLFGFFAEICVPLYSITVGYAQYLIMQKGRFSLRNNISRILKLLTNYWIILFLFSLLGILFHSSDIPISLSKFVKCFFLLDSYNGAWWYLNTYIILLLLPKCVTLAPIQKINKPLIAFAGCFCIDIIWYLIFRFDILQIPNKHSSVFSFIGVEIINLIDILPYVWIGALLCKYDIIGMAKQLLDKLINQKWQTVFLLFLFIVIFTGTVILHKAVLMGFIATAIFILFNLIQKPKVIENAFSFLGEHSTNIWLTHMFFYLVLFVDLVAVAKYPVLILLFMLALCIATSYVVKGIQLLLNRLRLK